MHNKATGDTTNTKHKTKRGNSNNNNNTNTNTNSRWCVGWGRSTRMRRMVEQIVGLLVLVAKVFQMVFRWALRMGVVMQRVLPQVRRLVL